MAKSNQNGTAEEEFNLDELKGIDYPFTNLVLEGGGSKGLAYVGVLKVFEEVGISKKIKRICGASAGAIVGTLLAVEYNSDDLTKFLEQDLEEILIDHKWGFLSLLPNLLNGFGWNPGNRLLQWFGEVLKDQTKNEDITFKEIYQKYHKELCIVVTNLSQMTTEYFHPKSTPNIPVRLAVRMSMSIPGVFQSVRHCTHGKDEDIYVDGGFLCNYPIHCFDGWWLSMKPEDSYYKRFQTLENTAALYAKKERFGTRNDQTLGLLLYSSTETELMRERLAKRPGNVLPKQPKTKLYKERAKKREQEEELTKYHKKIMGCTKKFLADVSRLGFDEDRVIKLEELETAFEQAQEFTKEDRMTLFGTENFQKVFDMLDKNKDGDITFSELIRYVQSKGVNLQRQFLGYRRKEINSFKDFLFALETALDINVKRNYVEERDIERTIGIDTDYIESTDFALEKADKDFLIESGRNATIAYLRYYKDVLLKRGASS